MIVLARIDLFCSSLIRKGNKTANMQLFHSTIYIVFNLFSRFFDFNQITQKYNFDMQLNHNISTYFMMLPSLGLLAKPYKHRLNTTTISASQLSQLYFKLHKRLHMHNISVVLIVS